MRLLLDMAQHYREGPVQLGVIARRQAIPVKYLEQIIIPLKKAGHVLSMRGAKGGHMLARAPEAITVGEIVELLEGGLKLTRCAEEPGICERSGRCLTRVLWKEAAEAMATRLHSITLADLTGMGADISSALTVDSRTEEGAVYEDSFHCHKQEEGNT